MGARGKKHGSGRKAARSSGTTRVDPRQPPASQGDRVGEPRKKSLAQSFALWFPVTGVVLAIVVAIVVLPQWRARHTIVSRLDNALATHDFAAAQLILREPEAVELLLQQPYGRDNPHTALWTALEAIVDSRRVPRGKDIIEHLHVATLELHGSSDAVAAAIAVATTGLDAFPLFRDVAPRSALEQCIIDRLVPVAKVLVPRLSFPSSRHEYDTVDTPVQQDGSSPPPRPVVQESAEELMLVLLEGSFHHSVYTARELLVQGVETSLFSPREAKEIATRCHVSRVEPSRTQALCVMAPVVEALVMLLAPHVTNWLHMDEYGQTVVQMAAKNGDAPALRSLVGFWWACSTVCAQHVSANAHTDVWSLTTGQVAIPSVDSTVINANTTRFEHTALHMAAAGCWQDAVAVLVDAGTEAGGAGSGPSMCDARVLVDAVPRSGGDLDRVDAFGSTPLEYALHNSCPQRLLDLLGAPNLAVGASDDEPDAPRCDLLPWSGPAPEGGWKGVSLSDPRLRELACTPDDVDVVRDSDMTPARFTRQYLSQGRPVLVRGAGLDIAARTLWTRDRLLHDFGAAVAAASFVPLGHEFAIPSIMVNVSTFLSEMMPRGSSSASAPPNAPPLYLYSHQAKHFCHDVHHDLPVPAFLADAGVTDPGTSFALGPAYSGSPMHFHASSWNTLVYGAKLWWLLPPEQAVFSREPMLQWLRSSRRADDDKTYQMVVQRPGDVLYIPEGWSHAVLNLADSVSASVEFDSDMHPHY